MKRLVVMIVFMAGTMLAVAQKDENEYNYFEVGSNIAKPVTIVTNLGTYTIWGGEVIKGHISRCTPRDADGNLIVNNQAYKTEWSTDKNKPTKKWWRFDMIYNTDSKSNDGESSSTNSNRSSSNSRSKDIADAMSNYADRASKYECYGYSNVQIRTGWSSHFGWMLTAKAELGGRGGYVFEGGVGTNHILDNQQNAHSWYFGVGIYGGSESGNDIAFTIYIGEISESNRTMLVAMNLEYSHFFKNAPHIGYYIGGLFGGLVKGNDINGTADIHAGLSLRLF